MKGKKTGGRQKGTPNTRTREAAEIADRLGVEPFEVLCLFAKGDWEGLGFKAESETKFTAQGIEFEELTIQPAMRLNAAKEAAKYLYPQRKAVELSTDENSGLKIVVEDYTAEKGK